MTSDCGADPVTIAPDTAIEITQDTVFDGQNKSTLSRVRRTQSLKLSPNLRGIL